MHIHRTFAVLLLAASECLSGACAANAASAAGASAEAPRQVQQFNDGWLFHKGEAAGAEQPGFDTSGWRGLSLPHDWSIEGPVDQANPSGPAGGFFPGGVGWYRKTISLARLEAGRRSFIVFDGVMANSEVWINGHSLGGRPSGYTSFVLELTPHLKVGENVIAVRCDNANEPKLRWYLGAGIYRQVRLVTTNDTHIEPWGSFVTTPSVSDARATVHVRSSVQSPAGGSYALAVSLVGPDGKVAASFAGKPVTLKPGASAELDAETALAAPVRWDIEHPAMYTARVRVTGAGKTVDNEEVPFGIRNFEFNPAKGFFLNGRALKIYGVGLHADAGALGTAVPLSAWERRLVALRKLGVNAIRTAHNAVAPEFLDLCDRLGFLVMDEFFDQWTLEKVPYDYSRHFKEWSERDVRDLVRRDRNHPGIILYSAGNEIRDTTRPELAAGILKTLIATYHANDPTRPVTQALFRPNVSKDYDNGYADLLDVVGQNYREKEILAAWAQKPTRKIIGTENTHELSQWAAVRDHPEYSGQFLWTGIDYLGEAGKWPTIGTGSGLLLTTGATRPRAFERQAWWTGAPMVRMARRVAAGARGVLEPVFAAPGAAPVQQAQAAPGAPARFAQPLMADWTPASLAPHNETVEIYTNADEVELSLNGEVLGGAPRNPSGAPIVFKVPFAPGLLKAVARSAGKEVASDTLRTAGKPARLLLTTDQPGQTLGRDVDAVAYLSATLVDEAGTTVPDSATVVSFAASGPGAIIAVDNGNLLDHDPFQATRRKLYNGQAVAIVRAGAERGRITVTVSAPGVAPASASIEAVAGTPVAPFRSF